MQHANIIQLKDIFVDNNCIYLAMECLVCDLGKLIDDERAVFAEEDVVDLFKQILSGVGHLHKNWILHRVGLDY